MAADFSHDPPMLPRLLEVTRKCDIALGSRWAQSGSIFQSFIYESQHLVTLVCCTEYRVVLLVVVSIGDYITTEDIGR